MKKPQKPVDVLTIQSEKGFARTFDEYAKSQGWRLYKTWTSIHSPAGFPDRTLVRRTKDGKHYVLVFVELKREKKFPTAAQIEWLQALSAVCEHVRAFLWKPGDWQEIEKILAR